MKNIGNSKGYVRDSLLRLVLLIILLMLMTIILYKPNYKNKDIEFDTESIIIYPIENTYLPSIMNFTDGINICATLSYINAPIVTTIAAETVSEATNYVETTTLVTTSEIIIYEETVTQTEPEESTEAAITTESQSEPPTDETVPIIEESSGNSGTYLGTFEATWYCAVDMGYSSQPCGSSGRSLESGFSIASNSIPSGSLVKITGGGLDGTYRVDDCGGMADNVIDFYYWDRSCVPYDFLNYGRINVEVYLIE